MFTTPGWAQQVSQVGRFSADFNRGCAPLTVNLTVLDDFGNITRQYFYEGEASQTIDTFYTYTTPGVYQIVQIVGVDVEPKTDTLQVEVFEPVSTDFNVSLCEGNEVQVNIEDVGYDEYLVRFSTSDEVVVSRNTLTASHIYSSAGTQEILVEGRYLNSSNNCGFSRQTFDLMPFENRGNIDDLQLIRSCIDNLNARVQMTLEPSQVYELMFSEDGINFSPIAQPTSNSPVLELSNISNSTSNSLRFRLDVISACSGFRIEGTTLEVDNPIATLPSLENAYATWNNSGITFVLDDLGAGEYAARKRVPGFDWETLDTLYNGFVDEFVSDFRPYEYEVAFADTCGNTVPNVTLSPAFVAFEEIGVNTYQVSWTPPVNTLTSSFSHQLVISGNNSRVIVENPFDPVEIFLNESQGANQVLFLETLHPSDTLHSNPRTLFYEFRAYLPDAFTPNEDGLNDNLRIMGINATEVDFKVFNRWGELIHFATTPNPAWDGKVRGEEAPQGRYFYRLSFLSIENKRIQQRGSFVLLR